MNDGDGGSLQIWAGLPLLFSIYLTLETNWLHKKQRGMDGRRDMGIRIGWFESLFVEIAIWADNDDWSKDRERRFLGFPYRTGCKGWAHYWFHPVDYHLGQKNHKRIATEPGERGMVKMPEGEYPVEIEYETWQSRRARWFPSRPYRTVRVKVLGDWPDGGGCIPYPGKGENSWDCGMDGMCSTGFGADGMTKREILDRVQLDVMEMRRKRTGSRLWTPPAKEVTAG